MEEQREVLLQLTREQSEIISDFINFNNWNTENIIVRNDWETESEIAQTATHSETVTQQENTPPQGPSIVVSGGGGGDHDPSNGQGNAGECDHCFCTPCITSNRQAWLGDGALPHMRNTAIRKTKYRKFWTLLSGANAWFHPRYLDKKRRVLQVHATSDLGEIYTKREIMPQCVLDLVRGLYPNLPGRPYMGHRWT